MKVKELKKILNQVDDDFEFSLIIYKKIPKKDLQNSIYPYPFDTEDVEIEFDDVGYSSKIIKFSGEIKEL